MPLGWLADRGRVPAPAHERPRARGGGRRGEEETGRLKRMLPKAAGLVSRPRTSASPSASSPKRASCAAVSALGTTVSRIKPWSHDGACETYPPAFRLVANCRGNSGFRNFSMAPFNHTAPTSILTHAMPLNPKASSPRRYGTTSFYAQAAPKAKGSRTGTGGLAYICLRLLYNCARQKTANDRR